MFVKQEQKKKIYITNDKYIKNTSTYLNLLPLSTKTPKLSPEVHEHIYKPTPPFCYTLPEATIKDQRVEEVEMHSYTQQSQLSRQQTQ